MVKQDIDVSIVIPIYNEEESLDHLYTALRPLLDSWERNFEVVLVDDGSSDNSPQMLREMQQADDRIQVVLLRRNFGQTAAFSAGFDHARGKVIVTMDGDLQNDPSDIPMLLDKMDEGYDIVSGWRKNRQDRMIDRKLPSQMANRLISKMTGVHLHDYGCSLKAYRREVIERVHLYGEMHRFIPALASWMGVRVAEMPVNHNARQYGKSKYGLGRIVRVILDLLTVKFLLDYATRPIQIFGLVGLSSLVAGGALGVYLTIIRLFFNQPIGDRPMVILAALLIMIGVQLIIMGLLGEIMVRTYHETQDKPIYVVREILGPINEKAS
ncbi:MAG: glycosyltransferase family 2 protein [Caldilineaceae bacterium]|nr:glycosyltransferase family 2 protein [Caldilineaceae bacterium]MCB0139162.1 glycosyltransferase family 2 protein [Caldilineaceae bacterium]MCB9156512.1 glycosyltransferase family 2 protein [Caldilineaceae bacterium]